MPEIAHTFRRVERSNERANASLQSFDRALRRLAQQCLQGMEHQLYWVELRRILRQVAQFCAASLDCLLGSSNSAGSLDPRQCAASAAMTPCRCSVRGRPSKL